MSKIQVSENIKKFQEFINSEQIDALFINDSDRYLNEYTPLDQTHYFLTTGFTGSTCKVLIPKKGKVKIYVDGRYHEQADLECDLNIIEVIKCPQTISIFNQMMKDIEEMEVKKLGVDGQRTSILDEETITANTSVEIKHFDKDELLNIVPFKKFQVLNPIKHLDDSICGKSPIEKVRELIKEDEIYFVSALDNIAWVTNARGFHLDYQSTYLSKCILTHDKIYVCNVEDVHYEQNFAGDIAFFNVALADWNEKVEEIKHLIKPKKVLLDKETLVGADYRILLNVFGNGILAKPAEKILLKQSIKNAAEIKAMEKAYKNSDLAVSKAIRYIQEEASKGKNLSEKDFFDIVNDSYKKEGAIDQSFHTIAAVGPNASIIHYSKSSEDIPVKNGDMLLLDSGALYEEGYSTDKTRTFLVGSEANDKQKEIYTLVLKGLLHAQNAIVPDGALGATIDMLARNPILQAGYNYLHGTGHGIGIATHEGGAGFSFRAALPIKEGQTISIEPGLYLPGFGGVRLENVVVVEKNESIEGTLKFKPLVYIGFDHALINIDMLTDQEKTWLSGYESECERRGTLIRRKYNF